MTGLEAFKIVYNNFDYLISDVCIENDDVNICLKTIKEQLPTIKQALQRLESIDNAKPSEALECVDKILGYFGKAQVETMTLSKCNVLTIKQSLIKAQEPKCYLKWEDLEFKETRCQYSNVKLGNANFQMTCYLYKGCMKKVWIRNEIISFELKDTEEDKQFFNDLHLERVEE